MPTWLRDKWEARWNAVGVSADKWTAEYIERNQDRVTIRLTPETLNDVRFWWWVITQPSTLKAIPLASVANFDADFFFRLGYDPQVYGGSRSSLLRAAKAATGRRTGDVAFVMTNSLTTSVVASTPAVTQLFHSALQHAAFTQRLHTLDFVRRAVDSEE